MSSSNIMINIKFFLLKTTTADSANSIVIKEEVKIKNVYTSNTSLAELLNALAVNLSEINIDIASGTPASLGKAEMDEFEITLDLTDGSIIFDLLIYKIWLKNSCCFRVGSWSIKKISKTIADLIKLFYSYSSVG